MLKLSVTSAAPADWSTEEWQAHYTERTVFGRSHNVIIPVEE